MSDINPCEKCQKCGHSRWQHQMDKYGKGFTEVHKTQPAECGKEGCTCKCYQEPK